MAACINLIVRLIQHFSFGFICDVNRLWKVFLCKVINARYAHFCFAKRWCLRNIQRARKKSRSDFDCGLNIYLRLSIIFFFYLYSSIYYFYRTYFTYNEQKSEYMHRFYTSKWPLLFNI